MYNIRTLFFTIVSVVAMMPISMSAETGTVSPSEVSANADPAKSKTIKKGEYVTIYMGREARNITIEWGEDTDCEFDIQISCGHGTFDSVLTEKAKGKGRKTYSYIRTSVEDLRIVILKGQGTIRNMETISTKADDNQSYNPI